MKSITVSDDTLKLLYDRVSKIRTNNLKAGLFKAVSYDSVIYDLLHDSENELENNNEVFENE